MNNTYLIHNISSNWLEFRFSDDSYIELAPDKTTWIYGPIQNANVIQKFVNQKKIDAWGFESGIEQFASKANTNWLKDGF